jgi:hypothetical protein
MQKLIKTKVALLLIAVLTLTLAATAAAQDDEGARSAAANEYARKLGDRDAAVRQRAAEELARLAAANERKLADGYRLQEKNARVKLALDWALYRMGKNEALFNVVNELGSSRWAQASDYLLQIEGPQPLYLFLNSVTGKTKVMLLGILGRVGTQETAERLQPFASSQDKEIAQAARTAIERIAARRAQDAEETQTRPRQSNNKTSESQ